MGAESTGTEYKVDGNGPTIKVTSTEGTIDSSKLSWSSKCKDATCSATSGTNTANWSDDGTTWSGTIDGKTINYLILRFNDADTSYVYNTTSTSGTTTSAISNVYASGNKASAITADFNNENLSITKLELYLSGTGTKNITVKDLNTLNGGLNIGSTGSSATTKDQYTYNVTVNTINGDLTVFGYNYYLQGTVTINTALNGNIYVSRAAHSGPTKDTNSDTAALTVKFGSSATMTGDIADRSDGYAGIRKDIYFAGSGTVLTGNIVSLGTSTFTQYLNFYTGNRIYFTQGDMKGNIIAGGVAKTTNKNDTGNVDKKGLNVVVFGDTTSQTTQTLTGGILASDIYSASSYSDTNTEQATNVIVLADSTTLNINGSDTTTVNKFAGGNVVGGDDGNSSSTIGFSVTSGSIVARNFGVNEIRIYKDSTLNLNNGSGSIKSYISGAGSTTTITNGSALNKINFLSEGGVINGSIVADNSKNGSGSKQASASALLPA